METKDQTSSSVKSIPDGYGTVTPIIGVRGVAKYLDFLPKAFGAIERGRFVGDDGEIMHAEMTIGNSTIMLGEASEKEQAAHSAFYLYVENADDGFAQAIAAGAESVSPPADQFYGDRTGTVRDPWGNTWFIATHVEDVARDEMKSRARAGVR